MTATPHLLTLPLEIRDQIWMLVFGNLHISPLESAYDLLPDCVACQSLLEDATDVVQHAIAVAPLLTCKQIYKEAVMVLYQTMTVHISSYTEMSKIGMTHNRSPTSYDHIQRLTLYTHLHSESRMHWFAELFALSITFPGLRRLHVNCHLRPPRHYDSLLDATYLLAPLVLLPECIRPSAQRAQIQTLQDDEVSEKTIHSTHLTKTNPPPSTSENQTAEGVSEHDNSQPVYASRDLNPNFSIDFQYCVSEVLFESPFIGSISTADALEEHDAVLRDCLANSEFRRLAEQRDLQSMTTVLFDIAREHEQVWLEGLHHRRMGTDFMETEILGDIGDSTGSDADDGSRSSGAE